MPSKGYLKDRHSDRKKQAQNHYRKLLLFANFEYILPSGPSFALERFGVYSKPAYKLRRPPPLPNSTPSSSLAPASLLRNTPLPNLTVRDERFFSPAINKCSPSLPTLHFTAYCSFIGPPPQLPPISSLGGEFTAIEKRFGGSEKSVTRPRLSTK